MAQLGSLMILFAIAAVGYVIWWAYKNDDAGNTGKTTGWFAMKDHGVGTPEVEEDRQISLAEARDRKKRPWLYHD